jgi:hypothetical protein
MFGEGPTQVVESSDFVTTQNLLSSWTSVRKHPCHRETQFGDHPVWGSECQLAAPLQNPSIVTNISSSESLEKRAPPPPSSAINLVGGCWDLHVLCSSLQTWSWSRKGVGGWEEPLTASDLKCFYLSTAQWSSAEGPPPTFKVTKLWIFCSALTFQFPQYSIKFLLSSFMLTWCLFSLSFSISCESACWTMHQRLTTILTQKSVFIIPLTWNFFDVDQHLAVCRRHSYCSFYPS